jgi:hypothetical protein
VYRKRPNKKQQLKHALKVQSAHVITTDYVSLSKLGSLDEGILLHDRTDRKLKLVHSLGELQPLHTYTTEYGNILERPSKHKAVLAGSVELDVTTDEADFDTTMGRLALSSDGGPGCSSSAVPTAMKMSSYAAFVNEQRPSSSEAGSSSANGAWDANGGGHGGHSRSTNGGVFSVFSGGGGSGREGEEEDGERLREEEALARIAALVSRLKEMEEWFEGVKAEAERERALREQSAARLMLMQARSPP